MNQSTLATQIAALTHVVDRLERLTNHLDQNAARLVDAETTAIHAVIDDLNTTYAELEDAP